MAIFSVRTMVARLLCGLALASVAVAAPFSSAIFYDGPADEHAAREARRYILLTTGGWAQLVDFNSSSTPQPFLCSKRSFFFHRPLLKKLNREMSNIAATWWSLHLDERIPNSHYHNIHAAKDSWRPRRSPAAVAVTLVALAASVVLPSLVKPRDDVYAYAALIQLFLVHLSGFAFVNFVTSCRPSLFRGRHCGYRDVAVIIVFTMLCYAMLLSARCWRSRQWRSTEWTLYGATFSLGLLHSYLQLCCGIRARQRKEEKALTADEQEIPEVEANQSGRQYQNNDVDAPSINNTPANAIVVKALCPASLRSHVDGPLLPFLMLVALATELGFRGASRDWATDNPGFLAFVVAYFAGLLTLLALSTAVHRSDQGFYVHLHHWILCGPLLSPLLVCELGDEATTSSKTSCVLSLVLGFCAGVTVEGVARWSCAPLWHKPRDEL
jgi:hypothetical protein